MTKSFRFIILLVFLFFIQITPQPLLACVESLSWGMDLQTVERHLGVHFHPVSEGSDNSLFEIRDYKISGLPVNSLLVRVEESSGLQQLAYEINYDHMTEVLAGLRHRFGPPVGTSLEIQGESSQQQWIWHTGEDVITAVKTKTQPFLLSYRPSRLDPSFL